MYKLLLIALLWAAPTFARTTEVVTGGLTYHLIDGGVSHRFSNQLSHDGALIFTPILGITSGKESNGEYESISGFLAGNSVGEPAGGGIFQTGFAFSNTQLGLVMGGYFQDDRPFRQRGIAPFVIAEIGDLGFCPVAGVAVNYKINLSNNTFLRLNNIISPVITNHTVSIGKDF